MLRLTDELALHLYCVILRFLFSGFESENESVQIIQKYQIICHFKTVT